MTVFGKNLVRVRRDGNSQVLTIPPEIRSALAIKVGDLMQLTVENGEIRAIKLDLSALARRGRVVQVVRDGE